MYWHLFRAAIYMDLIGSVLLCFKFFIVAYFFIVDSDPWIWPNVVPCTSKNHLIIFFQMTRHGWDVWTFPSMPLVRDLSSKGRGVSLCKYLHSHHAELHRLFATSLANLKKRVSLLHTSLNRQFDVHYCLEPLQFSHGYQREEQLMAIFFSHSQAALFLSHKRK